jgi:Amt family ammonium transporter
MFIESFVHKKTTSLGVVSGILAGLVAITPAAGVVKPSGAIALGAIASFLCFQSLRLKGKLGYDDSLDVVGIHGTGGIAGAIFLTFFIRKSWMDEAAAAAGGPWTMLDQLGIQTLAVTGTIIFSVLATYIIVLLVEKTVGLRANEAEERAGLDASMHCEHGYGLLNLS